MVTSNGMSEALAEASHHVSNIERLLAETKATLSVAERKIEQLESERNRLLSENKEQMHRIELLIGTNVRLSERLKIAVNGILQAMRGDEPASEYAPKAPQLKALENEIRGDEQPRKSVSFEPIPRIVRPGHEKG